VKVHYTTTYHTFALILSYKNSNEQHIGFANAAMSRSRYMDAISRLTRSSTERNGSLHKTVR
jgi:hypothetical protein